MRRSGIAATRHLAVVALVCLLVVAAGGTQPPRFDESTDVEPYTTSGGALDGETLSEDHRSAVEAAGTYTVEEQVEIQSAERSRRYATRVEVDLENGEAYSVRETAVVGNRTTYRYTNDNTTYRKQVVGNDEETASYATSESADVAPVNATPRVAPGLIDGLEWRQAGTEARDGVNVTRYEATGVANLTAVVGPNATAESVTDVNATMFVDADGIVRQYELTYTVEGDGRTMTVTYSFSTTAVGLTMVEEPDWIDEAKE